MSDETKTLTGQMDRHAKRMREVEGRSVTILEQAYAGLVKLHETYLSRNPSTPTLRASGVVYDPEPCADTWVTIPDILANGRGDAEDLACWRAAELRRSGVNARVGVKARPDGGLTCVVITPTGEETVEEMTGE